ncbi:MAG: hypothetical protein V4710_00225, partial [Verrucomicrobiota bacterium]
SAELLCGWMLTKLAGVTLSVTLDERSKVLPESLVARLILDCKGIRFSNEKGVLPLFKAHPVTLEQFILQHKPRRPIEPEWIASLNKWGGR